MDPNSQQPGLPPLQPGSSAPQQTPGNNPYGFILDTQHQPKKGLIPNHNPNSTRSRILVALGAGTALVIVAIIAFSLISGGGDNNSQLLTSLAAEQQEIIRVADLGVKGATDPSTQALAEVTKLSVISQQNKLTTYLTDHGVKLAPTSLNTKLNKATDTTLTDATASNRFNDVFTETIKKSLTSYAANVKQSYDSASNTASKTLLADSYNSTNNLLK
jgi:hypothetical protein